MAKNSSNSSKAALNRSFSFSGSPISQKVCVEESFKNKEGETLVRQYSCERIYDQTRKPSVQFKELLFVQGPQKLNFIKPALEQTSFPPLYTKAPPVSHPKFEQFLVNPLSNSFNFFKHCPEQQEFEKSLNMHNRKNDIVDECTPMEVDTSVEQEKSMTDVHTKDCETDSDNLSEHISKVPKMRITPRKITITTKKRNTETAVSLKQKFANVLKCCAMFVIPLALAMLLINSDIYMNDDPGISDDFQVANITDALEDLLYGQPDVISKLKSSLNTINDKHLLLFTGGIGVGKTYTAHIIANNFQWKNNIHKILSPQFKNPYHENNLLKSLSRDGYNLVIVDALEISDEKYVISFVKKVFATDKKVVLILIFNVQELSLDLVKEKNLASSSNDISNLFSEANIQHSLIVFNKLDRDVVRKCIRFAMAKRGLIINQNNIEHVLQNVNYEYSGCKRVYSKVALLR